METPWLVIIAFLGLLLAFWMTFAGRNIRRSRGLGGGETVSLDRVTLTSPRLGLTGRPDRLIRSGGTVIVEEWKSVRSLQPWHKAQMGAYFLLVEEEFKVRPPHGFLVTGDGIRHRIDNDDNLRAWVLSMAEQMRQQRAKVDQPVPANPATWQCRPCGMRSHCGQTRL